jgi:predicted methyltransferase
MRPSRIFASCLLVAMPVLAGRTPTSPAISAAVAEQDRPDTDRGRDSERHPVEMLGFAAVRPGLKIVELAPGGGYYTRLLSLTVGPIGKVYAIETKPDAAIELWSQTHPNTIVRANAAELAPEPVDLVWTTNNYHDFKNVKLGDSDAAAKVNAAAFRALKPGGIYLVADHAASPGAGASQTGSLHRIEPALVMREVEQAGFRFDASSNLLRNPADDHRKPIFDPSVQGKTDQFVLRFRKPG